MSGGAYSALSGMLTRIGELDRLAGDLANVGTAGYKTERAARVAAERDRDRFRLALDSAVDVTDGERRVDFRAGSLATTGRDLDLAIDGHGFFVIATPNGQRYTRNGSFTRRADGLLTTADGDPVLGEGGQNGQIRLGPGKITVDQDGTIRTDATVAGRLRIVEFDEANIDRESGARFRAMPGAKPRPATGKVIGGALEQANVGVVDRMVALTEIKRSFEALQRGATVLMNDIDGRAITELGRRG